MSHLEFFIKNRGGGIFLRYKGNNLNCEVDFSRNSIEQSGSMSIEELSTLFTVDLLVRRLICLISDRGYFCLDLSLSLTAAICLLFPNRTKTTYMAPSFHGV